MREPLLLTRAAADVARLDHLKVIRLFDIPECAPVLPPPADNGCSRRFNPRQAFALMILSDLIRWGLTAPHAGRTVARIADELVLSPNAGRASIEFRQNGASFVVLDGSASTEAAQAAGPIRFALVLDLEAYWAVLNDALKNQDVVIGGSDA